MLLAATRIPVVAHVLTAAELYREGFGYFAACSDSTPTDALWLALAGASPAPQSGLPECAHIFGQL